MQWTWTQLAAAAAAAALLAGGIPPAERQTACAEAWLVQEAEPAQTYRTLRLDEGVASVRESSNYDGATGRTEQTRRYALPNGDSVTMGRVSSPAASGGEVVMAELSLPGAAGTLRWYDAAAAQWRSEPLREGTVRAGCIIVSSDPGGDCFLYTPKLYTPLTSGTVRHLPALDGYATLRRDGSGWVLRLAAASMPAGCEADYLVVSSPARLLDWSREAASLAEWNAHDTLDDAGKWRLDGYYYRSPDNYAPSGENCYYLQPSGYLSEHCVARAPDCRAAWDLALATLDTISLQQNLFGYCPTRPESLWLSTDYGIGAGFYDTRFNTDLAENLYAFCRMSGCEAFTARMARYFDFFLDFAAAHHTETAGGGWLVADYGNPAGGAPTHTSLNHQLAEIVALLHYADLLDRPELEALAERMLQGVRDTAPSWIAADGDLCYAVYPDGSFGGTDYPYLTYNDLFRLREVLAARGRTEPALLTLMNAKRVWMDAHGVTGYLQ